MDKKESYQKLLKDPRWIKRRNEILTRDKNTCQFCGAQDKYLHVHHKLYNDKKKPWEYSDEELICICEKCHKAVTDEKEELYYAFLGARDSFRKFGFSDSVFLYILMRFSYFFFNFGKEEHYDDRGVISFIDDGVCGTHHYDDFKVLAKLGVERNKFIETFFFKFIDDYKKSLEYGTRTPIERDMDSY